MAGGCAVNDDPKGKGLTIGVVGTGRANMEMLAAMAGQEPRCSEIIDPIDAAPVISGRHGKAWLCDAAAGRRKLGVPEDEDGTLAHWIIEAPGYHPAWHSYALCLMHLRPLRTPRETLFYLDGATHELWLYVMDPTADRRPTLATGIVHGNWLTPANYVGQIIEVSDDLAKERIRKAVEDICIGKISPDTDYQSMWRERFGDHMFKDRERRITPKKVML
jgi:hypothetical protein